MGVGELRRYSESLRA